MIKIKRTGDKMCGICASIGEKNNVEKVVLGLKKLEYRGYDSSGIAYIKNKKIELIKSVGQIKNLEKKLTNFKDNFENTEMVIGHTRWATHGGVCETNAHPHISADGQFAIVHNGIVENFEVLKKKLKLSFYSQTDSEVFVNLISSKSGNTLEKIIQASEEIVGSFAVAILSQNEDKIFLAKRKSPLMVAVGQNGVMAASDISVFAGNFDFCYIMADDEFAVLTGKNAEFFNKNGEKIEKNKVFLKNFDFSEENSHEKYFMQSEINQQPMVLRKTFFKYFTEGVDVDFDALKKFTSFHFVACGTAYHSCLLGAKYVEHFCHKKCETSIASEFRYGEKIFSKNCLYVFVSQSGETADTIACAELVKAKGCKVCCVTNVPYCSLNNLADFVLPTFAGKEVAVASTKAYTAQVFTLLIFALKLCGKNQKQTLKRFVQFFETLSFPKKALQEVLDAKKVFFIGRGQDYVTALEASLKLKEIAYVNCLGIAAGELKHGTLALIDNQTVVIAILTQKALKEKIESNILEIKARGGKVLLLSNMPYDIKVDMCLRLPEFEEFLLPIVSIVPLQQLALDFCLKMKLNPDKPRNLAKSVTVE